MKVRNLKPGEEGALWALFHDTVHRVNSADYSPAQVDAWAPADMDPDAWAKKMRAIRPFVAVVDDDIVGYSDLQPNGLIDHFFVHHRWQGRGVGRLLMSEIERRASELGLRQLETHASITARPFFEAFGFEAVAEQAPVVRGVRLTNFLMRRASLRRPAERTPP